MTVYPMLLPADGTLESDAGEEAADESPSGKRHYRAVFISDTHFCSRDCQAEMLLDFLKHVKCEYLYIVGDLIDLWQLRRRWYWPQELNNVIQRMLKMAKRGTQVVYIPGNHDEQFRDYAGHTFGGVRIATRVVHITASGKRLLVMHGDEFDAVVQYNKWLAVLGSAAYDYLIYVNRILNYMRRKLGKPYWSFSGAIKRKVKNAVTYIETFEAAVVKEAKKENVDGIVCGHLHQPAMKTMEGLTYCNTGDWVENCTALVEGANGQLEIIDWTKQGSAIQRAALGRMSTG